MQTEENSCVSLTIHSLTKREAVNLQHRLLELLSRTDYDYELSGWEEGYTFAPDFDI